MGFEIVGRIADVEVIAVGGRIRDIMRLRRQFGPGRWRKLKRWRRFVSGAASSEEPSYTGTRHTAWQEEDEDQTVLGLKPMGTKNKPNRFALCVKNDDCEDLELRKIYAVLPEKSAGEDGYLWIVDESVEDYLYPEAYFVFVELPERAKEALAKTG